jgi:hypothetical protein
MPSNYRDKNGSDPFADEAGANPFADDGEDLPAESDASPYAASELGQTYRPEYEAILPHRGRLWFWLSIVGLLSAAAGLILWFWQLNPLGMFAVAASLPAAVLAWKDHQAIQSGAMDPTGRTRVRWAMFLGALGTAGASAIFVLWVRPIVVEIWRAVG